MKIRSLSALFFAVLMFLVVHVQAQDTKITDPKKPVMQKPSVERKAANEMRVMFYNVENMFDPAEDSTKADDEYQPDGMRGWSYSRLKHKQINIAKVILALGGWDPPAVIGVCEIENRRVLNGLIFDTPLKNFGYKIVHYESPDPRGIDVAMLYRPDKFKILYSRPVSIRFPFDSASRTRDILYVKGVACSSDTINIFVNHWPSKYGGAMETIPKRNYVASVLRGLADSLLTADDKAQILIMGDLNETPVEEGVSQVLRAKMDSVNLAPHDLYNMLAGVGLSWKKGTIKFHEEWETIDHMIVSVPLLAHTTPHSMHIFDAPFLLMDDEAWFGKKPFRTYYGAKYIGGFSDHLPVYMDLKF